MFAKIQKDDQNEEILAQSFKKRNRVQEKSWIESNLGLVVGGVILVLILAISLGNASLNKSSSQTEVLRSEIAKKILRQDKEAQASKITFTPKVQKVGGNVSQDNYAEKLLPLIKQPKPFLGMKKDTQFDDLPICIGMFTESVQDIKKIKHSLRSQQYKFYQTFSVSQNGTSLQKGRISLYEFNSLIKKSCKENSIVMLMNGPISPKFLSNLNKAYQTKNIWITYEVVDGQLFIHSAYQRVFELLDKNDFNLDNMPYLSKPDHQIITIGLLEISLDRAENVGKWKVSTKELRKNTILQVNTKKHTSYKRTPYDPAISLRQAFYVNRTQDAEYQAKMLANKEKKYVAEEASLTQEKMLLGLQYLELLYLPAQHFLAQREKEYYNSKYGLDSINRELPLCVCVPSHNNIQNDRYQRAMLSIMQQQYKNYHIVFIDDLSDDGTLPQTMRFMQQRKFPSNRIAYIQNLERNFATYNIINSALNYCGNDQIQVIVDGDDELVGRMIFKLVNYFYQYRENWIVYTSFISNQYTYGTCHPFLKMVEVVNENGERTKGHWIGHLTTWYVWFLKLIKAKDHKKATGEWYDTLYDDAFQHPLLQMAGPEHVQFVPQIGYLYNKNYGDNDDSNRDKIVKRWNLYLQLIRRKPYERIHKFDIGYQNIELNKELSNDYGKRYRQVNSDEVVSLRAKKFKILKQIQAKNAIQLSTNPQSNNLKAKQQGLGQAQKKNQQQNIQSSKQSLSQQQKKNKNLQNNKQGIVQQDDLPKPLYKKTKEPKMQNELAHLHPLIGFTKPDISSIPRFADVIKKDSSLEEPNMIIQQSSILQIVRKSSFIDENQPEDDLQKKMFFAYNLAIDPYNKQYLKAEYYIMDLKYNIGQKVEELPFCIGVIGRNNQMLYNYQYDSILRQNYSNYRIYFVDDHSENRALDLFESYVKLLPNKYKSKTTIIRNAEVKLALYNRHKTIKNNCRPGDIVLDLDSDDWLIGNQVLNTLNHLFQNDQNLWLFYSNIISVSQNKGITHKPLDFYPLDVMANNKFREWGYFKTSQLRAFRFQLYEKIYERDYINEFGQFYSWNSDMFMQFSLMELSCPKHCKKVDEFLYYYNYQLGRPRPRIIKQYQKMISLTLVPYEKLNSLLETPKRQSLSRDDYAVAMLSKILQNIKKLELKPNPNFYNVKVCTITDMQLMEDLYSFQDFYRKSSYFDNQNFRFVNFATLQIQQSQIDEFNARNKYLKHHQKVKEPKKPMKPLTYLEIIQFLQTQCKDYEFVAFAKEYPKPGSLEQIGNLLKTKGVWLLYDGSQDGLYANIYGLRNSYLKYIAEKGLGSLNQEILNKNYDFLTIPLLEIGNGHALKIDITKFFDKRFPSLIGINNNKYSRNRFSGFEHYKTIVSYD